MDLHFLSIVRKVGTARARNHFHRQLVSHVDGSTDENRFATHIVAGWNRIRRNWAVHRGMHPRDIYRVPIEQKVLADQMLITAIFNFITYWTSNANVRNPYFNAQRYCVRLLAKLASRLLPTSIGSLRLRAKSCGRITHNNNTIIY